MFPIVAYTPEMGGKPFLCVRVGLKADSKSRSLLKLVLIDEHGSCTKPNDSWENSGHWKFTFAEVPNDIAGCAIEVYLPNDEKPVAKIRLASARRP